MAKMTSEVTISSIAYRPCEVNGKNALFHKWADYAQPIAPSAAIGGHPGGQIAYTCGIVEYEDGRIKEVLPGKIRFLDNKHAEYQFLKPEGDAE